jgi:two-component system, cell cycle response regulator
LAATLVVVVQNGKTMQAKGSAGVRMTGKILIVDDVATNRIVLKVKLEAAFYAVLLAASGEHALHIAMTEQPELILLDLTLPDMTGSDVLRQLRENPSTAAIPVIVLSGSNDAAARMDALAAGADDFLTKPVPNRILMARLRNLMRSRSGMDSFDVIPDGHLMPGLSEQPANFAQPARIGLISDRPEQAMRWRRDLPLVFPCVYTVMSVEQALSETSETGSDGQDIYLIDTDLASGTGALHLVSDLRSRGPSRHAAICLMGQNLDADRTAMAFDIGTNDVILAAVPPQEIGLRLQTLLTRKRAADRARASVSDGLRMAMIDPLTGLYNRRYALPHLGRVADSAADEGSVFAVMLIDLDRFKLVNDRYGHPAGDQVLVEVALRLSTNMRAGDMIARIGGEEFLAVLPNTTHHEARLVAERLCKRIKDSPVCLDDGTSVPVTISIGLAFSGTAQSVDDIIGDADQALLRSKSAGRDRVTISLSAA